MVTLIVVLSAQSREAKRLNSHRINRPPRQLHFLVNQEFSTRYFCNHRRNLSTDPFIHKQSSLRAISAHAQAASYSLS